MYENPIYSTKGVQISHFVNGIVDSLPPGLLEGRPAGNSFYLTSHQLQQLQQHLQAAAVATASQQQATEQVATASGGLTLALHHTAGGGAGVPQLLLTSQATPSFAAYPVTSGAHTTSIQQVLQHHVRQSSILQSTIQQVGSQQTQQQSFTETSNGILNGSSKCIPVSPASPFSSRSLTPSPQQRVLTPQPVFQQVMNATVPVLQVYQPATRTTTVTAATIAPQSKNKPPQQILPKPLNIMTQTSVKAQPQQTSTQAGTLVLNQMLPSTGVLVGQQASNNVQLFLKSPSPQSISTSVPKAQVVVSSNTSSFTQSPNTVFVQANRTQPQQVVRLITAGQSLHLQQVQTSSGPAYVALPSIQSATLQQTSSTQPATVVPSVTTVPVQTSVFNQNVIKKTNHINASCINNQINVNAASNTKKKKRREEETTKLDLANLIKISGIDEEDVAVTPTSMASSPSISSLSSASSSSQSSPTSGTVQISSPCALTHSQRAQLESQSHHITIHQEQQCQSTNQLKSQQFVCSRPPTPKQNNAATVMQQIQQTSAPQCGLRLSIAEDGQIILHQPQITSQSVTASVAAAAQTQLAQLVAEHGNNILQTAVLSLTGESIMLKTPTGFALRQPPMVLQRATPNMVLATDPTTGSNSVRFLTDVSAINGLAGKVQLVSSNTIQDHNRVQIVNPGTMSLTEQQRVQIVTAGIPDLSSMSLTTEQQNHVQILTNVPSAAAAEVSMTEQQQNHRMEIISNVPNSSTTTVNEQKSRIQVIPSTRTVSVTEQLVSDISQQILTNVPSGSNIHEQNTRLVFQNSERNNEQLHISSSERTDVHITANALPEAIANQQTKLQMIANLPQNCAISLNEQNRFHIIPGGEFATIDDKNEIRKLEQQLHMEQAEAQHLRQLDGQPQPQRFHLISNLEEQQQRFMRVNDEQNRIIVEHQRVLNTSTMAFNEAQNRVQMVANGGGMCAAGVAEQQRLLQQLEEQRKIQIITSLPQQQCIVQLNEQQNKVTLKNIENLEQLQHSLQQQQQQQSLQQQQQQQRFVVSQQQAQKVSVEGGGLAKVANQQHHQLHHVTASLDSSFHEKLPEHLSGELLASVVVAAAANDNGGAAVKLNNQNLLHRMGVATSVAGGVESMKNRGVTFDVRAAAAAHQTCKPTPRSASSGCPPSSSVISPRCTPSPHSPFASGKSPSSHPSPQQSPAVACSAANLISPSCFSNRPNLTVLTQSSPPASSSAAPAPASSISVANQNVELTLNQMQGKPCAAVISHSNTTGNLSTVSVLCNQQQQQMMDACGGDRFLAPSLGQCNSSTSPPPPPLSMNAQQLQQQQLHQQLQLQQQQQQQHLAQVSNGCPTSATASMTMVSIQNNQNSSYLESIAQPAPHHTLMAVNKAIVSPCSKASVISKPKPKKKSAVVKPMVFQPEDKDKCDEGPACLNPMANNGSHSNVVQRVQTIQLTPQKQQSLRIVQSQIHELSSKKTRTSAEQTTLTRLFNEQQKILLSGKIVPTVNGQNTQGLTFVSTPVRLVPPPSTPPSPLQPSTPPTCNKATSPLHVQVGTQTTLDEPITVATPPSPSPPVVPVPTPPSSVPLPTPPLPTPPLPTPPLPTPPREQTPPLPSPPSPPAPVEPPVPILTPAQRAMLITEQLEIDQRAVTQPDTNTPFGSINDACKRLLAYHCLDEPVLSEKDLEKADEIFEATAKHLLDKNTQMLHKYSYLLCKASMREVQTSELIMLNRMFVADETQLLDQMKTELNANSNSPTTCSIATQADDVGSPPPTLHEELPSLDPCPAGCEFEAFMKSPPLFENHQKAKRPIDEVDEQDDLCGLESKKHCPDHEELNAQVQSAIDSILNLQRSDPVTDEAVRSILPS